MHRFKYRKINEVFEITQKSKLITENLKQHAYAPRKVGLTVVVVTLDFSHLSDEEMSHKYFAVRKKNTIKHTNRILCTFA